MALILEDPQGQKLTELAAFGREYDEVARLAGVPLWNELPDAQKLAIVAASERRHTESDSIEESYLTLGDIARTLRVSPSTISREVAAGRLPVQPVRGAKRVARGDLEAYLDRQSHRMQARDG